MRIAQGNWSFETAGWSIDHSDDVITLCPADVDAALQFSAFYQRKGNVAVEDLRESAKESLPEEVETNDVTCGDFTGVTADYFTEDAFWRNWWLGCGKIHLFITYNCDPENSEDHVAVVDWMLENLKMGSEE